MDTESVITRMGEVSGFLVIGGVKFVMVVEVNRVNAVRPEWRAAGCDDVRIAPRRLYLIVGCAGGDGTATERSRSGDS